MADPSVESGTGRTEVPVQAAFGNWANGLRLCCGAGCARMPRNSRETPLSVEPTAVIACQTTNRKIIRPLFPRCFGPFSPEASETDPEQPRHIRPGAGYRVQVGEGSMPPVRPISILEDRISLLHEAEGREGVRKVDTEHPEPVPTSLKLASLANAWLTQDRELMVRQREELRRALNKVAEIRIWVAQGADPPTSAIQDVEDFTQGGLRLIQQELRDEIAEKKEEVSRLRDVVEALKNLARTENWGDPVEVSYSHTVRQGDGLATRTQTLTLVDTGEVEEAAASFEKKLENWEKLRNQMQDDLEGQKRHLKKVADSVSAFAAFSKGVVADVIAIR
jgi:hypothetical protein